MWQEIKIIVCRLIYECGTCSFQSHISHTESMSFKNVLLYSARTCAVGLYKRVWWRRHPEGTGGWEPSPEYDHWTGTWNTHTHTHIKPHRSNWDTWDPIWASPMSLTIRGDCQRRLTWGWSGQCRCHWQSTQTDHNKGWTAPWKPRRRTLWKAHCSPTCNTHMDLSSLHLEKRIHISHFISRSHLKNTSKLPTLKMLFN